MPRVKGQPVNTVRPVLRRSDGTVIRTAQMRILPDWGLMRPNGAAIRRYRLRLMDIRQLDLGAEIATTGERENPLWLALSLRDVNRIEMSDVYINQRLAEHLAATINRLARERDMDWTVRWDELVDVDDRTNLEDWFLQAVNGEATISPDDMQRDPRISHAGRAG